MVRMAATIVVSCHNAFLMAIHDRNPVNFIRNHREWRSLIGEYATKHGGRMTRFNSSKNGT